MSWCNRSDMLITVCVAALCLSTVLSSEASLSTAASEEGISQLLRASAFSGSQDISSQQSQDVSLQQSYTQAESYGLNKTVIFHRRLANVGTTSTYRVLGEANVTTPRGLLTALGDLRANSGVPRFYYNYITITGSKATPVNSNLGAYLNYDHTSQVDTALRQVLRAGQKPAAPWRYGQGFHVTFSPEYQGAEGFQMQWLPRAHSAPPLPNNLIRPLKVTCTDSASPAPAGNGTDPIEVRGSCLQLGKTGGASLFFTEKFTGCSLVISQNPTDRSVTVAHLEPGVADDPLYKLRVQESLETVGTTIDGRDCRVVFGPKNYLTLRHTGTAGPPGAGITGLTPTHYFNMHSKTGFATVFGSRNGNGDWAIFAQIYYQAEDDTPAPGMNVYLREVMQLWPPTNQRIDLRHGSCPPRGAIFDLPGSLGERLMAVVPPTAKAVADGIAQSSSRNTAQADLLIASTNHQARAQRTPDREIREATALWRRQASKEDRLTMVPYRGPKAYLTKFKRSSPEVRRILNAARQQAAATLAAAQARYNPQALARASTARAVQAIAMVQEGVSPARASQRLMPQSFSLSSKFAWDGGDSYALDLSAITGNDLVNSVIENVYATLAETAPWLSVKEHPLPGDPLFNMQLSLDSTDKSVTFTAVSGNYRYLLALAQQQVAGAFGVSIPIPERPVADSNTATTAVKMVFRDGLQELSVGLGGTWTASSIASAIGASWPLEDDLFSITAPSVVFTNLPVALEISMLVDIPDLKISKMTSALMLQPQGALSLELYGSFTPIPHVTITSMTLAAVRGVGFSATAAGTLVDMPVSVRGTIASRTRAVSFELTASRVNLEKVLRTIFDASMVPDILLEVIRPLTFTTVTFTYAANKFGITAVPDTRRALALRNIMNAVGLDPADLSLRMGPNALSLGVSRQYQLDLPHPFEGPAQASFSVSLDAATKGVALSASCTTALRAEGVRDAIGLAVSATVATGAAAVGVFIGFSGTTTTNITFQDAPFISIGTMQLAASVVVSKPPRLQSLTLAGGITILGASADGLITYDQATRTMAFRARVAELNLQSMLQTVGVYVNLGVLNPILHEGTVSVSTVDIPAFNVVEGVFVRAKWDLLGVRKDVAFRLQRDGVEFYIVFDVSDLSRIINDALGELDKIINAAGQAMQDGSSHLITSREEAQRKLNQAQQDLQKAKQDLENARGAFEAARREADTKLRDAQARVASADRAFKDAVNRANSALSTARNKFAAADAAFANAKNKAQQDLTNARNSVNKAQRDYDVAIADARNRVNNAQASVDHLWGSYNHFAGRCDGWPWNWGNCVAAGAHWTAYQVATGVLNAARDFLNSVVNSAVKWALDRARDTLWAAERTAQAVLTGSHFVTRQTAMGVLHAAEEVARGVLQGTEFVALKSAQAVLVAANKVAEGVLIGAEHTAVEVAQAGVVVAEAAVYASEEVAKGSLTALSEALNAVGGALAQVKTENFIQVYSFGLAVKLKTSEVALGAKCHFEVAGYTVDGAFSLYLTDPVGSVMKLIVGEATKALKNEFKAIAAFLP